MQHGPTTLKQSSYQLPIAEEYYLAESPDLQPGQKRTLSLCTYRKIEWNRFVQLDSSKESGMNQENRHVTPSATKLMQIFVANNFFKCNFDIDISKSRNFKVKDKKLARINI